MSAPNRPACVDARHQQMVARYFNVQNTIVEARRKASFIVNCSIKMGCHRSGANPIGASAHRVQVTASFIRRDRFALVGHTRRRRPKQLDAVVVVSALKTLSVS